MLDDNTNGIGGSNILAKTAGKSGKSDKSGFGINGDNKENENDGKLLANAK